MPAFWNLDRPDSLKGRAEWDERVDFGEPITCPLEPGHRRGGKRTEELEVLLTSARIPDFVWTWYSECLLQGRVLALFRQEELTGFEVKPVRARMKIRTRVRQYWEENPGVTERVAAQVSIPPLWELVVTGWAGVAPPASGVRLTQYCPGCELRDYSCFTDPEQLIDPAQWDGSNVFMVYPMTAFVIVSDRVAQLIRSHKLRGARLVGPQDLRCEGFLGGGRLSDYMPEARARELGEPLGIY